MQLGAFSVSLAVKDIAASRRFYEKLGFATLGGDQSQGWLILRNGSTVIGLFQGMFAKNIPRPVTARLHVGQGTEAEKGAGEAPSALPRRHHPTHRRTAT